jgi:hypothetical protein
MRNRLESARNQTRSTCPSGPILRGISVFGSIGRTFTRGAAATALAVLAAGSVTFFAIVWDGFLAPVLWPVFFCAPGFAGAVCASGGFQTSTYRSPAYALDAMPNNATGRMNVRKKGLQRVRPRPDDGDASYMVATLYIHTGLGANVTLKNDGPLQQHPLTAKFCRGHRTAWTSSLLPVFYEGTV